MSRLTSAWIDCRRGGIAIEKKGPEGPFQDTMIELALAAGRRQILLVGDRGRRGRTAGGHVTTRQRRGAADPDDVAITGGR